MSEQSAPFIRRIAQTETGDCLFCVAAVQVILQGRSALFPKQTFMEKLCRLAVHFINTLSLLGKGIVKAVCGHRHSDSVAKEAHGLGKIKVFGASYEAYNLAAGSAAEAVKAAVFRINGKRGGFFVMKRAKPDKVFSAPLELNIAGHNVLNVAPLPQLKKEFIAYPHKTTPSSDSLLPDSFFPSRRNEIPLKGFYRVAVGHSGYVIADRALRSLAPRNGNIFVRKLVRMLAEKGEKLLYH